MRALLLQGVKLDVTAKEFSSCIRMFLQVLHLSYDHLRKYLVALRLLVVETAPR